MLSGYHSPLYDELYADWSRVEMSAFSGQSTGTAKRGRARTEVLWSNRELFGQMTLA